MSRAILFSLVFSFPGNDANHSLSSVISIAATSEIVLPSILKQRAFSFSLVPWQTGHTIFSSMSSTIPSNVTISDRLPSPTRNNSSLPNMMCEMASSGIESIGSYREKLYFRAIERIMSYFLVSRIFPSGTIPPSAIETDRSGMIVSIFTSTIIPSPLQ